MHSMIFKRRQKLENGDELVSVNYRGILFFNGENKELEFNLGTSNRILANRRFLKIKKTQFPEFNWGEEAENE